MAGDGIDGFTLKLGVPKRTGGGYVFVYGAAPAPPGPALLRQVQLPLACCQPRKARVSEITTPDRLRFGAPPPGSRVIIVTRQQLDGWRGLPMRFDVIIPDRQGPAAPAKAPPNHQTGA